MMKRQSFCNAIGEIHQRLHLILKFSTLKQNTCIEGTVMLYSYVKILIDMHQIKIKRA